MPTRIPLQLPPGIYRNGTDYQSKGRYFDCNLIRFYENTIRPIGGWTPLSTVSMVGKGRAMIAWKDNNGTSRGAVGTESHLYAMSRTGTVTDITPAAFTPGRPDAVSGAGYGSGSYGTGTYGTARVDTTITRDASMWSLDTFGEDLVGVMADDGFLYEWALNINAPALRIANAPTCRAVLVTEQGIMMALGANGNGRNVAWSDQRDDTLWTPDATNQAGDFDLQTYGKLMLGRRIRAANLLLTDQDAHVATYTADTLVYSFQKVGDGCGAISQGCAVVLDNRAVWMSKSGFFIYDGFVQPLPCDVSDFVYSNINQDQASKTTCSTNSKYGEVIWRYQSIASSEIDRYVRWNYRENHWAIGTLVRLSGVDQGVLTYPASVGDDGIIYNHEVGFNYDGAIPYLEGGPVELGNGDNVMYGVGLIPDDKSLGDVSLSLKIKFEPDDAYITLGPYTMLSKTDIRFAARQVNVRFDAVNFVDWRIGVPRLVVEQGGLR